MPIEKNIERVGKNANSFAIFELFHVFLKNGRKKCANDTESLHLKQFV
jgi:hypothetical protein